MQQQQLTFSMSMLLAVLYVENAETLTSFIVSIVFNRIGAFSRCIRRTNALLLLIQRVDTGPYFLK